MMKLQQYVVLLQYSEHVRMKALPGNAACQHSQGMQYLKTKHIVTDYNKGSYSNMLVNSTN